MRLYRLVSTLAVLFVTGVVAFGIGSVTAQRSQAPPAPVWVRADGTVDPALIPACIPMLSADGSLMLDAQGKPACYSRELMLAPPPPGVFKSDESQVISRSYVDGGELIVVKPESR